MRFALWAKERDPKEITPQLISGLFDITLTSARKWRNTWLQAISPFDIDGVPDYLTLNPREHLTASADGNRHSINQGIRS
ncbi:hypothetical protein [Xanthomonas citri]|nr:hypothetical protein [Xanthomonas citri]AMV00297.1 hypothetical protein TP37_21065 [Xanthomonas citri pv. aurantifolii]AMV04613.1 hypothetical protein TP50_20860 [Xanthomonas citri pv. aurantifolii]MCC8491348.1 hypothetical protein [Xanthomonas citri pv. fuscans]TBW99019.1 hypothetical protein TP49_05565 [Xanthomonas citri pv. aurantifolii]TBX04216.1 hypothetical protein TP46_06685 [Xanthomonas citri pv. aurantifolii]